MFAFRSLVHHDHRRLLAHPDPLILQRDHYQGYLLGILGRRHREES